MSVATAYPTPGFDLPPYHVEKFPIGACVCNKNGVNCLAFSDQPGAKFTSIAAALQITRMWNQSKELKMPSESQNHLVGAALDGAVADAEGLTGFVRMVNEGEWRCVLDEWTDGVTLTVAEDNGEDPAQWVYSPSTDWAIAGPIIEREGIAVILMKPGLWLAWRLGAAGVGTYCFLPPGTEDAEGPTPLIAAMRAHVRYST